MPSYIVYGNSWFAARCDADDEDSAKSGVLALLLRDDGVRLNIRSVTAELEEDDAE